MIDEQPITTSGSVVLETSQNVTESCAYGLVLKFISLEKTLISQKLGETIMAFK